MFKAQHVQQRHLDHHCIPHLWVLGELNAHEQAAVRSTNNPQPAGRGDLARHQILRDRVEVVTGWQAAPRAARSWLQWVGFDPGRWYAEQYIVPLETQNIRNWVAAFAGDMLSPEAPHRIVSAMLGSLLEALYAMPVMRNGFLLKLFGIETFWQEALLDPAGNETLPITVLFSHGQWLIIPGYHGQPRRRYLIEPRHIIEEQRQIHKAERVNSLAGWLSLLRWYNQYRNGVATQPYPG